MTRIIATLNSSNHRMHPKLVNPQTLRIIILHFAKNWLNLA